MAMTTYGDISPRTAAYAVVELLKRAVAVLTLEKFGQTKPLPKGKSTSIIFRRYSAFDTTPKVIVEGVTPEATKMTKTDVVANLTQYGDGTNFSDVVEDTHEDPILQEAQDVLGEQAPEMIERVRYGILKAGSNVFFANGTERAAVNTPLTTGLQRKILRALKQQRAKPISRVVRSTANYGTEPVAPSFIGLVAWDLESDVRGMAGFVPVEKYGALSPFENEIGKVENVRYLGIDVSEVWEDAGGAKSGSGTEMLSTGGVNADVYPVLYLGANAYGIVPLKGKEAIRLMVANAKPSDSDPWAQRTWVTWKTMTTACILNDLWMCRGEVACTANPVVGA